MNTLIAGTVVICDEVLVELIYKARHSSSFVSIMK